MTNELLANIEKLHTTEMGADRIKRNLHIDIRDVVEYCHDAILNPDVIIERRGKNWYVTTADTIITVNAHSYGHL